MASHPELPAAQPELDHDGGDEKRIFGAQDDPESGAPPARQPILAGRVGPGKRPVSQVFDEAYRGSKRPPQGEDSSELPQVLQRGRRNDRPTAPPPASAVSSPSLPMYVDASEFPSGEHDLEAAMMDALEHENYDHAAAIRDDLLSAHPETLLDVTRFPVFMELLVMNSLKAKDYNEALQLIDDLLSSNPGIVLDYSRYPGALEALFKAAVRIKDYKVAMRFRDQLLSQETVDLELFNTPGFLELVRDWLKTCLASDEPVKQGQSFWVLSLFGRTMDLVPAFDDAMAECRQRHDEELRKTIYNRRASYLGTMKDDDREKYMK